MNGKRFDIEAERIMSCEEQLIKWIDGDSVHNGKDSKSGECCPDFSCCHPELLWDKDARISFREADSDKRMSMCFGSLGRLVSYEELPVDKLV